MSELSASQRKELSERAESLAREAGMIAMRYFGSTERNTRFKGGIELVTEADLAVEEFLRGALVEEFDFGFLGEETGAAPDESGVTWVVDPIDGTTNFAHDIPHFAVSIGLWDRDHASIGVIYNPASGECFVADGDSVRFNGKQLPQLEPAVLSSSLLATGFPYDRLSGEANNVDVLDVVIRECLGVRRFGAAALDLAWVAAGRYHGFWEPRLKPWDVTAGIAMIETLGGRVTDYFGKSYDCTPASIVAGPEQLHEELLRIIRQVEGC